MLGDVHIARPAGDRVGRNRNFLIGRIRHVGLTIEEFFEHTLVTGLNIGRMFGDESSERQSAIAVDRSSECGVIGDQ
jgi:hypothetical protein